MEKILLNPRVGRPDDIAMAAVYLCSYEADYVTGANLVVDGGWSQAAESDARIRRSGGSSAR